MQDTMTIPLPSLIPNVLDEEKAKLTKAQQQALLFGCPQKYLYLADKDYLDSVSFKIHQFRSTLIPKVDGTSLDLPFEKQYASLELLVEDLWNNKGKSVFINSYPYAQPGMLLLWHLASIFAQKRAESFRTDFHFNHVGLMQVSNTPYNIKPRHIIAYGPVSSENSLTSDYKNLSYFLSRFEHYNRIVVGSIKDFPAFFERIHYSPDYFDYIFHLDCGQSKVEKKPAKATKKKPKMTAI